MTSWWACWALGSCLQNADNKNNLCVGLAGLRHHGRWSAGRHLVEFAYLGAGLLEAVGDSERMLPTLGCWGSGVEYQDRHFCLVISVNTGATQASVGPLPSPSPPPTITCLSLAFCAPLTLDIHVLWRSSFSFSVSSWRFLLKTFEWLIPHLLEIIARILPFPYSAHSPSLPSDFLLYSCILFPLCTVIWNYPGHVFPADSFSLTRPCAPWEWHFCFFLFSLFISSAWNNLLIPRSQEMFVKNEWIFLSLNFFICKMGLIIAVATWVFLRTE